jgi:hypothetical protein
MVLRPTSAAPPPQSSPQPAWTVIEETQHRAAREYLLITQPDHAALAGAIAAALGPPLLPELPAEVVGGISVHDDGWAEFDARTPSVDGRPVSFIDLPPSTFLQAWRGSIERAAQEAPIAGAIVSRHFWRLGTGRLNSKQDTAEDERALREFLHQESARQDRLTRGYERQEFEFLTDVLQFCDVLSLYLCCGATQDVEFPQSFSGSKVRLTRVENEAAAVCRLEPTPFRDGADVAVMSRRFPASGTVQVPFLLY